MALIRLGSGITGITGSIGGTVYQNSASGTISKNKGNRVAKDSYQSDKAKTVLSGIQQYWQTMSDTERATWKSYAIFKPTLQKNGTGRFINGQQIFTYYAYRFFMQFGSIPSAPSFVSTSFQYTNYVIQNDFGVLNVNLDYPIDESSQFLIIKISNSVPVGRSYATGGVKYIKTIFASSAVCDISALYISLYGRIPEIGEYVIIEAQLFSSSFACWSNLSRLKVAITP